MNWLAKIGKAVAFGLQLATGFSPLFAQAYPNSGSTVAHVTDDLTKVAGIIQTMEVVGQTLTDKNIKGPDKLRAAVPQIAQVVLQSEIVVGHKIKDEALYLQGCSKVGDGMADIMNSLE